MSFLADKLRSFLGSMLCDKFILLNPHGGDKFDTFLLLKQLLWMEETGKVENLFDSGGRLISLGFRFYKTKKIVQTYVVG